jgi:GNAT superfamily N-acetyltransferase
MLRAAIPGDEMAVATVHVRSWQVGYRGLLPDSYLDALRPEDRAARYTFGVEGKPATIVAVKEGAIRGFATTQVVGGVGELVGFYVDPDWWNRRLGVALITAARSSLAGLDEITLWLLRGNARGEKFYRADGWTPDGAQRTETIWGATIDELRFRRTLLQ